MTTFAIVDGNVVENIAVADDQKILELLLPEKTVIAETETTGVAWVGAEVINGKFKPPQPYESWVWNNKAFTWEAPKPKPTTNPEGYWEWDEETKSWIDRVFVVPTDAND